MPSHACSIPATFRPRGVETLDSDWDAWTEAIFVQALRPSLVVSQEASAAQNFQALLAADAALGAALPQASSSASLSAGRRVLLDFIPPRGAKLLERLRGAAEANDAAGHLATVFAVRANIFHIPSVQASGALLLAECILGAGVALPAVRTAEMIRRATEASRSARGWRLLAV